MDLTYKTNRTIRVLYYMNSDLQETVVTRRPILNFETVSPKV